MGLMGLREELEQVRDTVVRPVESGGRCRVDRWARRLCELALATRRVAGHTDSMQPRVFDDCLRIRVEAMEAVAQTMERAHHAHGAVDAETLRSEVHEVVARASVTADDQCFPVESSPTFDACDSLPSASVRQPATSSRLSRR